MTIESAMEIDLYAHPAAGALHIVDVSARLTRIGAATIDVQFRVDAPGRRIALPSGTGERRSGLWKSTCFELFIADPLTPQYREFNFAPGGDWAAYQFDAYRAGMRNEELPVPPLITAEWEAEVFVLTARLSLYELGADSPINFAAVIDEQDFHQSLWATDHAEKPDFHARHCFGQKLPPLEKP